MTLAHGSFRNKLTDMARRRGKKVLNPSEAYTSKCCSTCGYLDGKLGGAEIFRCLQEGKRIDRDVNGARGIFLRALLDGSLAL